MAAVIPAYRPYVGFRARTYEERRIHTDQWQLEQIAIAKLLARTSGIVLDIPVGTGRFHQTCARLGRGLIGMDISPDMLAQASAKGTTCCLGDARDIPMPDKSIDTILCLRLLNWFEPTELLMAMREFRRVARVDVIFNAPVTKVAYAEGFIADECLTVMPGYDVLRVLV